MFRKYITSYILYRFFCWLVYVNFWFKQNFPEIWKIAFFAILTKILF